MQWTRIENATPVGRTKLPNDAKTFNSWWLHATIFSVSCCLHNHQWSFKTNHGLSSSAVQNRRQESNTPSRSIQSCNRSEAMTMRTSYRYVRHLPGVINFSVPDGERDLRGDKDKLADSKAAATPRASYAPDTLPRGICASTSYGFSNNPYNEAVILRFSIYRNEYMKTVVRLI